MDYTKIPSHIRVPKIGPFELFVLFLCEVCHGTFQFGDDCSSRKTACGQNTKFGFSGTMRVARRVGYLDVPRWVVELEVARCVAMTARMNLSIGSMDTGLGRTWQKR